MSKREYLVVPQKVNHRVIKQISESIRMFLSSLDNLLILESKTNKTEHEIAIFLLFTCQCNELNSFQNVGTKHSILVTIISVESMYL